MFKTVLSRAISNRCGKCNMHQKGGAQSNKEKKKKTIYLSRLSRRRICIIYDGCALIFIYIWLFALFFSILEFFSPLFLRSSVCLSLYFCIPSYNTRHKEAQMYIIIKFQDSSRERTIREITI